MHGRRDGFVGFPAPAVDQRHLLAGFGLKKCLERRIAEMRFPRRPRPEAGRVGDGHSAFAQEIEHEQERTEPVFPAVDTVKVDEVPDLGHTLGIAPMESETAEQAAPKAPVFGRHGVEDRPVAIDTDQIVILFRKVLMMNGWTAHGMIGSFGMQWTPVRRFAVWRDDVPEGGVNF